MPKAQFLDGNDTTGSYFTLNPDKASKFWMPDVFIDQAKALRVPTYYTRPASLRLYRDSTIRYSSRQGILSVTESLHSILRINYDVACNMDFHRFPVDEQYCEVKFESFGFSNKQVCCVFLDAVASIVLTPVSNSQSDRLIGSLAVACMLYSYWLM